MNILKKFYKRFIRPVIAVRPGNIPRYVRYFVQRSRYLDMHGTIESNRPILGEDTATHNIDPHYFFQGVWAARHITRERPDCQVDVGSQTDLLGYLSAVTRVVSVELRPIPLAVPNITMEHGSVLQMPFPKNAISSLSCLHVAEHVGLGRYGDPLDPLGTKKACRELARVLAPGGRLYFSVPIGRERTEFNAHRIHRPDTILSYMHDLKLLEFSVVTDDGAFVEQANIDEFKGARYACGLFLFTKES